MSYSFDGTGDYLTGSFTSTYADPVTLACWFKVTTHPVALDCLVALGNSSSSQNDSYMLQTGSADDAWRATSRTTGDSSAEVTSLNRDATWTAMVGVFTSNTLRDLYVGAIGNTAQSTDIRNVADVLQYLSVGHNLASGQNYTGLLAEVAIWNKALDTSEITSYLGGTAASGIGAANLIGYWPLSASNATQANLGTDAGGDLTVTNATYSADHPTISSSSVASRAAAYYAMLRQ